MPITFEDCCFCGKYEMRVEGNLFYNQSLNVFYYAWICLYSEHIFWYMRSFCFKNNEFEYDDLMLMYNALITQFCEICRAKNLGDDNELESLFNKAVKVLELRHAIIHKGFPNLLPIVFENKHVRKKPTQKKGDIKLKFSEDIFPMT